MANSAVENSQTTAATSSTPALELVEAVTKIGRNPSATAADRVLQTYLGLRGNLAVNEGARSFIHESNRDRTPLGHAYREHVRGSPLSRYVRCTDRL